MPSIRPTILALAAYWRSREVGVTVNNAWAEGEEANKGSLTAGKLADLVIIDRDLFAIPAAQLEDARVLLTMVDGRVTYAAHPFNR